MQKQEVDYIIVGGGLAGLITAYELTKRNKSFVLFESELPCSSMVAAGTWNPISFKRMIPTWRAEEMLVAMNSTYAEIENTLQKKIISFITVEKIIANENEEKLWKSQCDSEESKAYMESEFEYVSIHNAQHTLGILNKCGRVNLPEIIEGLRKYFKQENKIFTTYFEYENIKIQNSNIEYKNITSKKIIFCEGSYLPNNPYFNWVPLKPVKGDVLTIFAPELQLTNIRKKNIFILPLGNGLFRVGATYNHSNLDWEPSEADKELLLLKLNLLIDVPYEIVGHESGIRPASNDRRPILGSHPKHKNLIIFNGLGSKGVFLAPLLVKELIDYTEFETPLKEEVDIKRYLKKHFELVN